VVIPGSCHYCLEEAPEEVVAALTAFLARTRADRPRHTTRDASRRVPAARGGGRAGPAM